MVATSARSPIGLPDDHKDGRPRIARKRWQLEGAAGGTKTVLVPARQQSMGGLAGDILDPTYVPTCGAIRRPSGTLRTPHPT